MENVVLIILLVLAVALIGVVLMQRFEGGGLGIGGGGGGGGMTTGRSAANALTRLTWILGAAFMAASLAMTVISAQNASGSSVVDRLGVPAPTTATESEVPSGDLLLPPSADDTAPLTPVAE